MTEAMKLEACPFCGEEAEMVTMSDRQGVRCAEVMCAGSMRLPMKGEDAASAWNRRASPVGAGDRGWRPIETAPKDGADLLLLCDGYAVEGMWWEPRAPYRGADGLWSVPFAGQYCQCGEGPESKAVTHWMPLPAPPHNPERAEP